MSFLPAHPKPSGSDSCFLKFILDFFIPCSFLSDSEHKKHLSCLKAFVLALLLVPLTLTLGSFVCIRTTKSSVP